jgi:hypothetical protein
MQTTAPAGYMISPKSHQLQTTGIMQLRLNRSTGPAIHHLLFQMNDRSKIIRQQIPDMGWYQSISPAIFAVRSPSILV